jgi:hypothetical protein
MPGFLRGLRAFWGFRRYVTVQRPFTIGSHDEKVSYAPAVTLLQLGQRLQLTETVSQPMSPYLYFFATNSVLGNLPCTGNAGELCGGSTCIVIFGYRGMGSSSTTSAPLTIASAAPASSTSNISTLASPSVTATTSYPTSTGTPNCLDRSPFTGTINAGYLILCDTPLPGYDLAQVNGADLADCIAACNSYVPPPSSQQEPCVAVEYDEVGLGSTHHYCTHANFYLECVNTP